MAIAPSAHAQQYDVLTLTTTNNIAATTTNSTLTANITLTKHDQVGLLLSFKALGATTSNVTFLFRESLDGTTNTVDTTRAHTFTIAADGTTTVNLVTNITVNAVGYLRLTEIRNTAGEGLTNIVVKYSLKPKRNG